MTMTTRPTSHFIHSGFLDILSLIPENQAQTSQAGSPPQSRAVRTKGGPEDDLRRILDDDALSPRREKDKGKSKAPPTPSKSAVNGKKEKEEQRRNVEPGLRKRKVDKGMIGPPMDFR